MKLTERAERLNLASGRTDLPALILMSDATRLPDPSPLLARLPVRSAVMVRHPDGHARAQLAEKLLPLIRAHHLYLLISDDLALARDIRADGLHLPETRAAQAWTIRRAWDGLLTAAAHSPPALRRARAIGCDAAVLSSVFPTASHPDRPAVGLLRFLAWAETSPLPVYALGGVTAANAGRLRGRHIVGIAGIGGLQTE